ncbi:MAG: hypothetical protein V5A22_00210 [Salinivenus sp.]
MLYALRNSVLFSIAFLVGTLLLAAPPEASAQEVSYAKHDYMKVPSGQAEAYLQLEQDLWKPIHRQRAEDGTIAGWNLYEVVYPAGADREYDYVTVTFYEEWDQLESPYETIDLEQIHPDKDPQEITQQTVEARRQVHSEVVEVIDSVTPETEETDTEEAQESENGGYLVVDFMEVPSGGGSAYVQMEQDLFKPVHRQMIEQSGQQSWFLVERQYADANDPYQYMTIQPYASWSDVEPGTRSQAIESAFQEVHPDAVASEIGERVQETRTVVRREVWRLVDSVEPSE